MSDSSISVEENIRANVRDLVEQLEVERRVMFAPIGVGYMVLFMLMTCVASLTTSLIVTRTLNIYDRGSVEFDLQVFFTGACIGVVLASGMSLVALFGHIYFVRVLRAICLSLLIMTFACTIAVLSGLSAVNIITCLFGLASLGLAYWAVNTNEFYMYASFYAARRDLKQLFKASKKLFETTDKTVAQVSEELSVRADLITQWKAVVELQGKRKRRKS